MVPDHFRVSLVELLQGQQEMMMKAEERGRLAMQELMKFEMEAERGTKISLSLL